MATPTLKVGATVKVDLDYVDTDEPNSKRGSFVRNLVDALTSGTGEDQADLLYWSHGSLAKASTEYDLRGVLQDVHDNTLTYAKIKGLLVYNKGSESGMNLTLGAAGSSPFANWLGNANDKVTVDPEGVFWLWSPIDGYTVGAGSDRLKLDAGSSSLAYEIFVIGTSA